jgi:Spy/CpxP family protein refolding chaperone
MISLLLVAVLTAAPSSSAPASKPSPHDWQCSTGRNRLQTKEARESYDQIKAMKKDNSGGIPPEAQKILNQMTSMYEKDGSKVESDMAELMREFAGGKAERRTAC